MTFEPISGVYIVKKDMNPKDSLLVEECLNGDKQAFSELVNRYQHAVYNLAYRMTGNTADAEDLTQDTFIRAFKKLGKYKPEYAFRNWVLTICSNLTKNVFRKRTRQNEAESTHVEIKYLSEGEREHHNIELEAALESLSPTLRAPLILKHVEGLSYEEIAAVLGIGVSAAKMRVKRARDDLNQMLSQGNENDEDSTHQSE